MRAMAWGMLVASCAAPSGVAVGGEGGPNADETLARTLSVETVALPPRTEVIRTAQGVVDLASREQSAARSSELSFLAARLYERLYRVEHREQDVREAIDIFKAAGRADSRGGCEGLVRAALLSGESLHDASVSYAEAYRVYLRAPMGSPCRARTFDAMVSLAPFAPPREVLLAIEQGTLGEDALRDAGASRLVGAPRVSRIQTFPGEDAARVVLTLDRPARFRAGEDSLEPEKGTRTYVELDGVEVPSVLQDTFRDLELSGLVRAVHTRAVTTGTRVVLDLAGPAYRRVFHLVEPYRVVIDIARQPPGVLPKGRRTVAHVVLDPGHGGNDPGATGPSGTKEKDVTLAVAQRTSAMLERVGIRVTFTRADDRYVTLEERTARANGADADLFVSIHCNASESKSKRGVETYVLDTTTNDIAARVAARENATSQAANAELGSILATMRLADQSTRSTRLADLLQRAALSSLSPKYGDAIDGGVHQAGFYVLVGARMPAVLFETSYVSNAIEEERLAQPDYQQRLADGIVNAIRAYREGR